MSDAKIIEGEGGSLRVTAARNRRLMMFDTKEMTSGEIGKRIFMNLSSKAAHELAQWIIDNIEKPAELPTELGLYQDIGYGDKEDPIEHAVTYRHSSEDRWVNAVDNTELSGWEAQRIKDAYREGRLVRLVREEIKS